MSKAIASRVLAAISTSSLTIALFSLTASAFSGDFLVSNIFVDNSASQTGNGPLDRSNYIYFDFTDQDTPQLSPVPCLIYWPATSLPTSIDHTTLCANSSFQASIVTDDQSQTQSSSSSSSDGTSKSSSSFTPQDFEISLSHTYMDDTIGQYPQNFLTKFGGLNVTWPGTEGYACDVSGNKCFSRSGIIYLAEVTRAIS